MITYFKIPQFAAAGCPVQRLPHAASVEDYEALLPWNCSPEMPR
ncbi:Uncharacterized protein AC509_4334 [Pseudomonas amygdali pv. morsprunorum]|nr:Uncharacterized protein AC509_4334 [Pseudomonas amygdali pv. morsprunorum]